MGQITKQENEKRKAAKREAKAQKRENRRLAKAGERPENVRSEIIHFLIVCEGEKTEPNYFKSLVANDKYSRVIDIEAEIIGGAKCTISLVNEAEKIYDNSVIKPDRVWVVFDKDDFKDFNEAIQLCIQKGFNAGWTNEAFELWYYLHFEYLDTSISRHDYIKKIESFITEKKEYENFKYKKNDEAFYKEVLSNIGDEQNAKKYASKLRELFKNEIDSGNYTKAKPCTTIDILVEELHHPEKLLEE